MATSKLSATEREQIDALCKALLEQAWSTEPIDQEKCRNAAAKAYQARDLKVPQIIFCPSPIEAMFRLQALSPDPTSSLPRPMPDVEQIIKDGGTSLAGILDAMMSAQPQIWPALGDEVDLSFHEEVGRPLFSIPYGSETWSAAARRVDSKVGDLCHLAHAVTDVLEAQVTKEPEAWLLYTQGASSLWSEAIQYGYLEAAMAIGQIRWTPDGLPIGRELLGNCGWVYAFEQLCLICDRPSQLQQSRNRGEVQTSITWRDGTQCERVWS